MSEKVRCWECGHAIAEEDIHRREVDRGSTMGGWLSGKFAIGHASKTERVTLCPSCTKKHDEHEEEKALALRCLIIIVLVGAALLGVLAIVAGLVIHNRLS